MEIKTNNRHVTMISEDEREQKLLGILRDRLANDGFRHYCDIINYHTYLTFKVVDMMEILTDGGIWDE